MIYQSDLSALTPDLSEEEWDNAIDKVYNIFTPFQNTVSHLADIITRRR